MVSFCRYRAVLVLCNDVSLGTRTVQGYISHKSDEIKKKVWAHEQEFKGFHDHLQTYRENNFRDRDESSCNYISIEGETGSG